MFDQTSGFQGTAKLTHNINHHRGSAGKELVWAEVKTCSEKSSGPSHPCTVVMFGGAKVERRNVGM